DSEETSMPTDETCPICIDGMKIQKDLRQLPCLHIFHTECIDEWLLQKSATCPMCK
ncbi:hypothetical protein BJ085DRAFT_5272, partial [Dimargaris cristalligena]